MGAILNMPGILSLALHALCVLSKHNGRVLKSGEIANEIGCTLPNLARSLQMLKKSGILATRKGPGGGYLLRRPPETITMLEIQEAVDGPLRSPGCGVSGCKMSPCNMKSFVEYVTDIFRKNLEALTLKEFLDLFCKGLPSPPALVQEQKGI